MSAGSRSGVNCMRLNLPLTAVDKVLIANVFAKPGKPSSSTCPPASIPMSRRSIMVFCPTMTLPVSSMRVSTKALSMYMRSLRACMSTDVILSRSLSIEVGSVIDVMLSHNIFLTTKELRTTKLLIINHLVSLSFFVVKGAALHLLHYLEV